MTVDQIGESLKQHKAEHTFAILLLRRGDRTKGVGQPEKIEAALAEGFTALGVVYYDQTECSERWSYTVFDEADHDFVGTRCSLWPKPAPNSKGYRSSAAAKWDTRDAGRRPD